MPTQKHEEERERQRASVCMQERERHPPPHDLWLLFLHVFPPPGPALCKLGQTGALFVLPEVLTPVLRPSFVLFSQVFPFLVF